MARTITVDRHSLCLNDRRVQLVSGAFHYFRVPRSEWRDRLEKSRRGGLNTVETVVPWNVHEDREGQFDFEGNRDLAGFLQLCGELGLYTFVRPSPYICAEWDNGGLPAWLLLKQGVAYRRANPVYLAHIARWYDELIPRIAAQQWTRGGSVILVQIENEYGYFHDAQETGYLEFLRDALLARGIEVALTTCDWPGMGVGLPGIIQGGNCGSGFRDAVVALRRAQPEAFAFISELWLAWFDAWGGTHHTRPGRQVAAALQEVLAAGGHYNFYMWAGGTNPGYTAGRTTTGDYGAFITTSYDYDAPIGETGNLTSKYYECRLVNVLASRLPELFAGAEDVPTAWSPASPEVRVSARRSAAGTTLFLHNPSQTAQRTYLRAGGKRFPETFDWSLPPGDTRIVLEDYRLSRATTLTRCSGEVLAQVGRSLLVYGEPGAPCELQVAGNTLTSAFPTPGASQRCPVGDGEGVLLARDTAAVTWVDADRWHIDPGYGVRTERIALPELRWRQADPLVALDRRPATELLGLLPLERVGIFHGYGWYRTRFAHGGGTTTLTLTGVHDRAIVLVNGERQGTIGAFAEFAQLPVDARPGVNDLCILLDVLGRYTFTSRLGEPKGLLGAAYLGGGTRDLPPWSVGGDRLTARIPWQAGSGLVLRLAGMANRPVTIGMDAQVVHRHRSVADDDEWIELDVTPHLRPEGNVLWVEGASDQPPRVRAASFQLCGELSGPWRVAGGIAGEAGGIDSDGGAFADLEWQPLRPTPAAGRPTLFACGFALEVPADAIPLQVVTAGLSKGVAWINGHHLGRYWEVGPQKALVVPHEWLATENTLVVFDEEGRLPTDVRLVQHDGFIG